MAEGDGPFPTPEGSSMADWKRLARAVIVAEGEITPAVAAAVRTEFLTDGTVARDEVEFLLDLWRSVPKAVPEFHQFVFHVVKRVMLQDGEITVPETAWLKGVLFADQTVDRIERQLLKELKEAAVVTCKEFDDLCAFYESV